MATLEYSQDLSIENPCIIIMSDALHSFLEEKLRLSLTGEIPGHQIDTLVQHLNTLFKVVRPSLTAADIFIAVSGPSVCGYKHCCCNSTDCRLDNYKITIFIERRQLGRQVTRPWVRASSTEGFEDAVNNLMATADEMIEKVKPGMTQINRNKSSTCLVEVILDSQEG
ncbi:hypothetical protein CC80DRAFT_559938 [Byssothecium circinans]|uniref:Uncharacterized protein n=1 Tax=Byssothecium circinans TaxID=147558 RepID=A0A6A5U1Q9_9PLEO|nr:hypothetical protein CC80DRAFT_559938 [Byssothecium circinans]